MTIPSNIDLICLSHLRWGFVFQRPQHLLGRAALSRRVFFVEEPVFHNGSVQLTEVVCPSTGVHVITPLLPEQTNSADTIHLQQILLGQLLSRHQIHKYLAWYYTPMARRFSSALSPLLTVYDCMDELSAFQGAPVEMRLQEQALFRQANLVFTGGASLFESKKSRHRSVHLFPSSVDRAHFALARTALQEPDGQQSIPRPRLGYAGVIDERMDLSLIQSLAAARPDYQIVMLGPVVKINPASLPTAPNIHYLGMKSYSELPAYLAGWDAALLPFALNESTRFISPTKTPEYLSAGLPVVSTPIRDVVEPYGTAGLVEIADSPAAYAAAIDRVLGSARSPGFLAHVDHFLTGNSWDKTWRDMESLIAGALTASAPQATTHFVNLLKEETATCSTTSL